MQNISGRAGSMRRWIFTDGSCTTHVDPMRRRAGWAAVEVAPYLINGEIVKISAMWGTIPAAWPQSAPASEFAAATAAAETMDFSEETRILADCSSVIAVMAGAPRQQLHASRPWAGAYRLAHAVAMNRSPLAAIEKVPAHTVEVQGESGSVRLRRLANEWADDRAKAAVRLHPAPSPLQAGVADASWCHAEVACRVLAEATLLWPAAVPDIPRRPPTQKERQQRAEAARARRAARTRQRQAAQEAQWKAADDSHSWVACGSLLRCARCQTRRLAVGRMDRCPGMPLELAQWAAQAKGHRHVLAHAALWNRQAPERTVAVVLCVACGAWTTAAAQAAQSLLLRPCRGTPTKAGADALSRVARGLHPKAGCQPPLLALSAGDAAVVSDLLAAHRCG